MCEFYPFFGYMSFLWLTITPAEKRGILMFSHRYDACLLLWLWLWMPVTVFRILIFPCFNNRVWRIFHILYMCHDTVIMVVLMKLWNWAGQTCASYIIIYGIMASSVMCFWVCCTPSVCCFLRESTRCIFFLCPSARPPLQAFSLVDSDPSKLLQYYLTFSVISLNSTTATIERLY